MVGDIIFKKFSPSFKKRSLYVYVTNQKFNTMAKTKKFHKPSKEETAEMYIKANKKGSRDAEIENATGFITTHKVHKSKKAYSRKPKHGESWGE
jgi:hypothetical protein